MKNLTWDQVPRHGENSADINEGYHRKEKEIYHWLFHFITARDDRQAQTIVNAMSAYDTNARSEARQEYFLNRDVGR